MGRARQTWPQGTCTRSSGCGCKVRRRVLPLGPRRGHAAGWLRTVSEGPAIPAAAGSATGASLPMPAPRVVAVLTEGEGATVAVTARPTFADSVAAPERICPSVTGRAAIAVQNASNMPRRHLRWRCPCHASTTLRRIVPEGGGAAVVGTARASVATTAAQHAVAMPEGVPPAVVWNPIEVGAAAANTEKRRNLAATGPSTSTSANAAGARSSSVSSKSSLTPSGVTPRPQSAG
jgi:hypothetical protein